MSFDDYTADQAMREVRRQWHEERAKLQEGLRATQRELEYIAACSRQRNEENAELNAEAEFYAGLIGEEHGETASMVRREWRVEEKKERAALARRSRGGMPTASIFVGTPEEATKLTEPAPPTYSHVLPTEPAKIHAANAELAEALLDCVAVMDAELKGLAVIQPELRNARAALARHAAMKEATNG